MKTARRFILSIFLSFKKVYLETCNVSDKHNKVLVSEGHNLHCNILMENGSAFRILDKIICYIPFLVCFLNCCYVPSFFICYMTHFDTIQFSPTILLNYRDCISAFPITQK